MDQSRRCATSNQDYGPSQRTQNTTLSPPCKCAGLNSENNAKKSSFKPIARVLIQNSGNARLDNGPKACLSALYDGFGRSSLVNRLLSLPFQVLPSYGL